MFVVSLWSFIKLIWEVSTLSMMLRWSESLVLSHAHAGTAHPWHGGTADHEVPSQQVLLLLLAMLVGLFPFHLDGGSDGGRRVRLDAGGGSSDFLLVRRHGGFVLDDICLLDGHRGGV